MQITILARRSRHVLRRPRATDLVFVSLLAVSPVVLGGCGLLSHERTVVDRQGLVVSLERDPSIRRADTPVANAHPGRLNTDELRTILRSLMVSGWSGTLVGMLEQPRPIPVFTDTQLDQLLPAVTAAFAQATPEERVTFTLPQDVKSHATEQTMGALFLRDRYLHIVLTDHTAFTRTNTAGMEERDPRDTKGMKLWLSGPAMYTMVPDVMEPRWATFDRVHLSINIPEFWAFKRGGGTPIVDRKPAPTGSESTPRTAERPTETRAPLAAGAEPQESTLQQQVQQLTTTNQELRSRLDEQQKSMQVLQDELATLRQDLAKPKAKTPTPARK
ncbi:MAG: hypothetical protein U0172_02610 [Nitrospiraceae bacterium]